MNQAEENINHWVTAICSTVIPSAILVCLSGIASWLVFFPMNEGDQWLYWHSSSQFISGQIPYQDFPLEYPPLALLLFSLPHWLPIGDSLDVKTYTSIFGHTIAIVNLIITFILSRIALNWRKPLPVIAVYGLLVIVLSPVLLWRFDLWPTLFTVLGLFSALSGQPLWVGIWIGTGVAAKLYPIILLPVFGIYYWIGRQHSALLKLLVGCVVSILAILLPFFVMAPTETFSFLSYHGARGLQIESLPAGLICLLKILGVTSASIEHNFGAWHLVSPLSLGVLKILPFTLVLSYGGLLTSSFFRFREEFNSKYWINPATLVIYIASTILIFIINSKVFSAQYIIWLLPFIPLIAKRKIVILLCFVCLLTVLIFPFNYGNLFSIKIGAVLLLNLRNSLIVLATLALVIEGLPSKAKQRLKFCSTYLQRQVKNFSIPWFGLLLLSLWLASLALRVWGLSRFNELIFDEVYYAKYGYYYLTEIPFFDAHPPLGKYLIGFGIWLAQLLPWDYSVHTTLTDPQVQLPTLSYRWMNALIGSFVPLIVAGIAYELCHRRSYALLSGLFTSLDGFLLVESRYALLSIYILFFGLLGHYCFLRSINIRTRKRRIIWLGFTGLALGASSSVKWYGLGFWLGLVSLWGLLQLISKFWTHQQIISKLQTLSQLRWVSLITYLGIVPVGTYILLWIPHLKYNPDTNLLSLHQQILSYHLHLGSGIAEHPYCSSWTSWPLMQRPIGYLYKTFADQTPSLVYDVHGMGNPVLWWLSTLAIIAMMGLIAIRWSQLNLQPSNSAASGPMPQRSMSQSASLWVGSYLIINYLANWLPWSQVSRCAFTYYYLNAVVFAFMALAWFVDQGFRSPRGWQRGLALSIIVLVAMAFCFWLPIYLGLPLTPEAFHQRMWFKSWY